MEKGYPTHTQDITGKTICLGDLVGYDFDDEDSIFEVVFQHNAFRKKYVRVNKKLEIIGNRRWLKDTPFSELECGQHATTMKLKILKSYART